MKGVIGGGEGRGMERRKGERGLGTREIQRGQGRWFGRFSWERASCSDWRGR